MNRRESLKAIGLGTLSTSLLLDACKTKDADSTKAAATDKDEADRLPGEKERDKKLAAETFFNAHEMATLTILADIIIPKDEVSGSATEAGVPEFIEFIVKDMPNHQTPMRGGLRWLDIQTSKQLKLISTTTLTLQSLHQKVSPLLQLHL